MRLRKVPEKLRFVLSEAEAAYISDLLDTGLYGRTWDEAVSSLLLAGIRNAVESGHINLRSFRDESDT